MKNVQPTCEHLCFGNGKLPTTDAVYHSRYSDTMRKNTRYVIEKKKLFNLYMSVIQELLFVVLVDFEDFVNVVVFVNFIPDFLL